MEKIQYVVKNRPATREERGHSKVTMSITSPGKIDAIFRWVKFIPERKIQNRGKLGGSETRKVSKKNKTMKEILSKEGKKDDY